MKGGILTATVSLAARPAPTDDYRKPSTYRKVGIGAAFVGLMGTLLALIANLVAAAGVDEANSHQETLAWTLGLSILSFGTGGGGRPRSPALTIAGCSVRPASGRAHGRASAVP